MKITPFVFLCLLLGVRPVSAGVIFTPSGLFVDGVIEGSGQQPILRGDTIDST